MIPPLGAFLRALDRFVLRHRLDPRRDEARIAQALKLAEELSRDHPEEVPAAILFALSRQGRALGAAWERFPLLCARNLARDLLDADLDAWPGDVALEELRLRIASKQATFEEVRVWIAERMKPLR